MSIEIIDQRAFLRTRTGIILLTLGGSNNCTMLNYATGREIRERSWGEIFGRKYHNLPEDELIRKVKEDYPEDCDDWEMFKYQSKWITTKSFYSWVERGCKSAFAVEQYIEFNPGLSLRCGIYFSKPMEDGRTEHGEALQKRISTSAELSDWLDDAEDWITFEKGVKTDASIWIRWNTNNKITMPIKDETCECWIKEKGRNMYLYEFYEGGSRWTSDKSKAMTYPNAVVAAAVIRGTRLGSAQIVKVTDPVDKNWVIYVEKGPNAGQYIYKKTRRRYFMTHNASQAVAYPSEKAAIASMNKICSRSLTGNMVVRNKLLVED